VLVAHYEYDANGNRMSVTRGAFTTSYSYDDQDRLLSAGDVSYAYDQAGALQTRTQAGQSTGYRYDALGNLTAVDLPDGRHVTYTLDALGRRIERKVDGTLTQAFLYAPETQGPVAQLNAAGEIVSRFVYATSASVPDYFTRGGHSYQIIRDDLGSPRLVLDTQSGQVAEQLDYDEYGRTLTDTNPALQPFGYAGGLKDTDTGLVHFAARDYDPEVGRWTTKDPIGLQGGDTDLYAYAGGDPINNTDPTGLISGQDVANFGAGFGDAITFGRTRCLRDVLGIADRVDMTSPTYTAGGVASVLVPIPAAGILEAAEAGRAALAARHVVESDSLLSRIGRRLSDTTGEFDPFAKFRQARPEPKATRGDPGEAMDDARRVVEKESIARGSDPNRPAGGSRPTRLAALLARLFHPPHS